MAGLAEAERAATAAEVAGAYRVLLGRDAESAAVLREKAGQPLASMIAGLLAADEFTAGVAPLLAAGRPLGDRFADALLPADVAWVRDAADVSPDTVAAAARADTWRDLLLAL